MNKEYNYNPFFLPDKIKDKGFYNSQLKNREMNLFLTLLITSFNNSTFMQHDRLKPSLYKTLP